MPNRNVTSGLIPTANPAMHEDISSQELPCITRVAVYLPSNIYQQLAVEGGGPANLMNALLLSSVDVQVNNGTTGMHYHARISQILPAQNPFSYAILNDRSSLQDAGVISQLYEDTYPYYQVPNPMHWEHVATTPDTGSSGFGSALGDLNSQAALQVHHPVSSLELSSTMQPILPSTSSSTATLPFNAQPFLDGPNVPFEDGEVSHNSEHEVQSPHGHQIQQPGRPRAYVVDGLLVDEEDLVHGNSNNGFIHVHACNREDSLCGLWVKADRRSIIRHGQRRHGDARGGGDRLTTCTWLGCDRQMRASDVPRHALSAHFGVTWICRDAGCSKVFSRHDSFKAHAKKRGCLGAGLGAIMRYDDDTRLIDIHDVSRSSG
ncbi:hypothetical protein BDR07DRAFT_1613154 [Suillus spraguei]|nr:hypothetical protein BDR07DRAFT_1613154 [Suillus spraguei]